MTTVGEDGHARKGSLKLWVCAAVGAVGIHAGCIALAMANLQTDDSDDAMGAVAIEIGLEMAAPRAEPSDLPPGPDVEASAAAPAVTEQKEAVKETDLPKAEPTETDDPDRLVSPDTNKKPDEEEPTVAAPQAAPSNESVASEATAAPTSDTLQEAPKAVAPAIGTGRSAQLLRTTWQKQLIVHLDKHKRYPTNRSNLGAEILVSFVLDRTGKVLSMSVVKGSGDAAFDEAALAMIKRSDPVPAPPPLVADEGLSFTLPVIFRVKGHG